MGMCILQENQRIDRILESLSKSNFRSKFYLKEKDKEYVRKKGIEITLEEISKELGVYEQVKQDGGWGNVSSKKCGNIVTKAIEIANRSVE